MEDWEPHQDMCIDIQDIHVNTNVVILCTTNFNHGHPVWKKKNNNCAILGEQNFLIMTKISMLYNIIVFMYLKCIEMCEIGQMVKKKNII